jgi:molybdenum cofactor synthesis domain-containing protein
VAELLGKSGFHVVATRIVQDDSMQIQNALVHLALEVRFIVTTGGTGIALRDVTPEATEAICERLIDGVGERMRKRGFEEDSVSRFEPRGVRGAGQDPDPECAGQSKRRGGIAGSGGGAGAARAEVAGRGRRKHS